MVAMRAPLLLNLALSIPLLLSRSNQSAIRKRLNKKKEINRSSFCLEMTREHDTSGHGGAQTTQWSSGPNSFAPGPPRKHASKRSKAHIGIQGQPGNSAGYEEDRIIPQSGTGTTGQRKLGQRMSEGFHQRHHCYSGDMQDGVFHLAYATQRLNNSERVEEIDSSHPGDPNSPNNPSYSPSRYSGASPSSNIPGVSPLQAPSDFTDRPNHDFNQNGISISPGQI